MKQIFSLLLATVLLFSCSTTHYSPTAHYSPITRYYYIAEEPIHLYEFPSLSGIPLLTTSIGDTVYATGVETVGLGGPIPVEYKGFRFYSPSAKARLIHIGKIKNDETIAAAAYETILAMRAKEDARKQEVKDSIQYWSEQDKIQWYGQVIAPTVVLVDSYGFAKEMGTVSSGSVMKIKRFNYSYWQVSMPDGKIGYVATHKIEHFSKSLSPFTKTEYTGRTYSPYGEGYISTMTNTPTAGATIHTGPRGGQYYINSHGNKIYVPRSSGGGRGRR